MYLKIACQSDAFYRAYKGKVMASSSQKIFKRNVLGYFECYWA